MSIWNGKNMLYPLTKEEIGKLRKGETLRTHFHPDIDKIKSDGIIGVCPECGKPYPILIVAINKKRYTPDDFKEERKSGCDATSILVTDADLDRIENIDTALTAHYEDFSISIVSKERYDKNKTT